MPSEQAERAHLAKSRNQIPGKVEIMAMNQSSAVPRLAIIQYLQIPSTIIIRAQAAYDTEVARRKLEPKLKKIRPWQSIAASL